MRLIADTVVELVLRLARENVRRADLVRLGGWPCHRCSATPTSPGASNRLEIVLDAVAHPDTEGLPWLEEFPRDVLENAERDLAAAGARHYLALVDRGPAGAASMGIEDGVRAVQRRDGSRVPPPGCAVRPAGRPGRRRDRGRVRARPRHGSAGVTLAAERPAPRVRPALHASHAGALTPGGHHEVSSRWLTPERDGGLKDLPTVGGAPPPVGGRDRADVAHSGLWKHPCTRSKSPGFLRDDLHERQRDVSVDRDPSRVRVG